MQCITRLDVSENNLDVELASVVHGVTKNRSALIGPRAQYWPLIGQHRPDTDLLLAAGTSRA